MRLSRIQLQRLTLCEVWQRQTNPRFCFCNTGHYSCLQCIILTCIRYIEKTANWAKSNTNNAPPTAYSGIFTISDFNCFLLLSELTTILLHPICQFQNLNNLEFQCFPQCFVFWLFLSGCIKHSLCNAQYLE